MIFTIIVLLVGHDALMAMNAHEAAAANDHHHEVVDQGCGALEGTQAQPSITPMPPPPVAFLSTSAMPLPGCEAATDETSQIESLADASSLRAMIQVFLN